MAKTTALTPAEIADIRTIVLRDGEATFHG